MNTFLIISQNTAKRKAWIEQFSQEKLIDPLDITLLESEGSIGIEDIRRFQKSIVLKPLKGKEKAAVIANAQTLTIEAQNALLKTLEEPPDNTYLILSADTDTNFLPTILSRTSIVAFEETKQFGQEELEEISETLQKQKDGSLGDRLKLAEALAGDKEQALLWIEKAIHSLRKDILTNQKRAVITSLENFQETYKLLKTTNVNTRLALENLFLHVEI